jgi:hypothetical protein
MKEASVPINKFPGNAITGTRRGALPQCSRFGLYNEPLIPIINKKRLNLYHSSAVAQQKRKEALTSG